MVSVALDVLARLGIRSASHARRISTLVSWIAVACTHHAFQVAVIVQDISAAFVVVIQLGFVPTTIAGLAAGMKIVATDMDVLARLHVRAVRSVSTLYPIGGCAAT